MNDLPRILPLFANHKWTGPADPAIRSAARLRAMLMTCRRFYRRAFIRKRHNTASGAVN